MSERFHRRSIRLQGYDYRSAGAYYVTVCTHQRGHLFGDIVEDIMVTNAMGQVVQGCWDAIPEHMRMVVCDELIVMPNHIHGIIVITDLAPNVDRGVVGDVGAGNFPPLHPQQPERIHPLQSDTSDVPRRPPIAIMVKNSLGHILQTFKAAVSRQVYRDGLMPRGMPIW